MVTRWGGVLKGLTAASSATASSGGGVTASFTAGFVSSDVAASTSSTNYTFSGQSLGAANAARIMVCGIGSVGTVSASVSACFIAGVLATRVTEFYRNTTDGDPIGGAIYQAAVPAGTTGTVQVNFAGSKKGCAIGLWRIVTGNQAVRFTGSNGPSLGSDPSVAATVPSGGYGVVVTVFDGSTPPAGTVTPTNYTEDWDTSIWDNGTNCSQGGHFTANATLSARGTKQEEGAMIVYASWGP